MRIRRPRPLVNHDGCTPLDHVFPSIVRGTTCYCGQREWGVEPKRTQWEFLKKGKVKRTVRFLSRFKNHDVLFFRECGHIVTKERRPGKMWTRVRCRMCERVAREVRKDFLKRKKKEVKRRAKQQRLMEKLLQRKRIRIRLKRQ